MNYAGKLGAISVGVAVGCMILAGCEWESGSTTDSTLSERYNWVNFSGVYRPQTGGRFLAAEFGSGVTNTITGSTIATVVAGQTVYSGVLPHRNIIAATFRIVAGTKIMTTTAAGVISGDGAGTLTAATGAWNVTLTAPLPAAGTSIVASYQSVDTDSGAAVSGRDVFTFTVQQSGNSLSIVDNNGAVYSGQITSIKSTGGSTGDNPNETGGRPSPLNNDVVTASFRAEGRSSSGTGVTMVGTFTGTVVTDATSGGFRLTSRTLNGTWIEAGGRTADLIGVAP